MTAPDIIDRAEIAAPSRLDDKWFSPEGTVIDDPAAVLGAFGVGPDPSLADVDV